MRHFLRHLVFTFGIFFIVFLAGATILFRYQQYLQVSSQPLTYFRRITWHDLYAFLTRPELLDGSQSALANMVISPLYSKLDGTVIRAPEEVMIGIMIDNHPEARAQQAGLSQARIVYEALAEGDITRFLAIFSDQAIDHVGPVRSARPYFVRWAEEYSGGYGHAGGSSDALALIAQTDLVNLEGLYYEEIDGKTYFYRDSHYYAPHNLFAVPVDVKKLVTEKKTNPFLLESRFAFGNLPNGETLPPVTNITIDFSDRYFRVEYVYEFETSSYKRFLAGSPHIDHLTETQISPRNILVQITSYYPYDEEGRLKMRVFGQGKALIFTQGKMVSGTWQKEGSEMTKFYDGEGKDVVLTTGQTWIEVLDEEEKVRIQ